MIPVPQAPGGPPAPALPGHRLLATALAGALLAALASVVAGFALLALRDAGATAAPKAYRAFLADGGWLTIPLLGAAAGCLTVVLRSREGRRRARAAWIAAALVALAIAARPIVPEDRAESAPTTRVGRVRAIRRWAYRSPEAVARILPLADEPDPVVREAAIQALGANAIVTDVEHPADTRPSRRADDPLRGRLRDRLEKALADPEEPVRVQAARALWQSPVTFGDHAAAADTLAATLARAADGGRDRLAWIALAAAHRRPDARLAAAARSLATRATDRALADAARRVVASR